MRQLNTNWIWTADWNPCDDLEPRIVCFRKAITLDAIPTVCSIKISADSRYKLYVNDVFVNEGPAKGDRDDWYYDTLSIQAFLRLGENVISAEVLRYPSAYDKRNFSLIRTDFPCLYLEQIEAPDVLSAKEGWTTWTNRGRRIKPENTGGYFGLVITENVTVDMAQARWKENGFDDTTWHNAVPYTLLNIVRGESPFHLAKRNIPLLIHKDKTFSDTQQRTVPSRTKQDFVVDAGALANGYPLLRLIGGRDATVKILCSECYAYPPIDRGNSQGIMMPVKGDRTDAVNGQLYGNEDCYSVSGFGTENAPERWEPFWFRTFRFIRVSIETQEAQLTLLPLTYRSVEYPLEVKTKIVETSDDTFADIWDISERTLRCCMMETYFDCPSFEQLQYAMDARSEILFTYAVAADDRLARQCMDALRRSQRSDGLLNACAPSIRANVIPGFSIYYLLMVHDHMMYFGDKALVRDHLPTIERILRFFDMNLRWQ